MLRWLYDGVMRLAAHRRATTVLALVAFAESSVFPIPPDAFLIPMVLARPQAAFRLAAIATVASVAGGVLGYGIGYLLWETVGRAIVEFYGYTEEFRRLQALYAQWGLWIVAIAGFTPFPYKVVTIASGVVGFSLPAFVLASVVSRAGRFFLVAALLWAFGETVRDFVERRLGLLTLLFTLLLIGGFLVLRHV